MCPHPTPTTPHLPTRPLTPQLVGGPYRGEVPVDGLLRSATRLASDSRAVARLVVELTTRLQQAWQQRHGLLEVLTALAVAGGLHPLKYLQGARQEYLRALVLGSGFLRPGGRLAAATRRRRTLSRLQPMTAQTSPEDPLSFFDAFAYALAYLPVISALACTRQPLAMPTTVHGLRGQFYVRRRVPFARISNESRRWLA